MNIQERIDEIYEVELNDLIRELKSKTKGERTELYEVHKRIVFPKTNRKISLDKLLNDNVKVDREKFRHCFMVICNDFFSTNLFGDYNVRRFKKKTGLNTDRFFQKVILTLSLLGYIKGIKWFIITRWLN